jgi:hypothetical protein
MYEMYRLRGPVKYAYKAAVGTTTNGEILMGVDYDARDVILTYQGTAALSPKCMGPVWRDHTLVIPTARAMKQKWLTTSNGQDDSATTPAFGVNITGTATGSTGSVWVEYHIEFCSPRAPTSPAVLANYTVESAIDFPKWYSVVGANPLIAPIPYKEMGSFVAALAGLRSDEIIPTVAGWTATYLETLNGRTELGDTPWDGVHAFRIDKLNKEAEPIWLNQATLGKVVGPQLIPRVFAAATNINVLRRLAKFSGYSIGF